MINTKFVDKVKLFIASAKNKTKKITDKVWWIITPKKRVKKFLQNSLDEKLVFSLSKSRFPSAKQLQQLPHFLSDREKMIIKTLTAVIFICIIFLGTNFYLSHIKIVPAMTGEYIEGVVGYPQYINPLFAQLNDTDYDLVKLIFSGLLKYDDESNELKPDLCTKYEISDDQKEYTFYLRDNLLWQDEEPLTADDIIFTVELAKLKDVKSPLGKSFNGVTVEKVNDKTIKFILPEPYAPFLSALTFGILPKHIWEDVNLANINLATYNLQPIGSGPYEVKSRIIDKSGNIKSYILTVNNSYYLKKPYIKDLTIDFFSSYNEAVDALKTKSIQGLSFIPTEFSKELAIKEHLNNYPVVIPQYTAIFFNQEKNELLSDKRIRMALSLAIDKNDLINKLMEGKAKTINGPIITKGWNQEIEEKKQEFNPEKSRELIKKMGFKKENDDQFYNKEIKIDNKKEKQDLTITITSVNSLKNAKLAEMIKNYWGNIGVKTEIKLLDPAEIKKSIEEKNYEALVYGEVIGFDPDPYPFWHSSQIKDTGLNLSCFKNKEADKLIEEARMTIDKNIRKEKYKEFQKILDKEFPAIFLYQPIYDYKIDKNIKGVKISNIIIPGDRFSNITKWYIKTKKEFSWR